MNARRMDRATRRVMVVTLLVVAALAAIVAISRHRSQPERAAASSAPALPSTEASPATVWAVGDGADGGSAAKAVVARIRDEGVDRLLYLGDVYGPPSEGGVHEGTAADYRTRYDPVYGALAAKTAPTPGDHEWSQHAQGYDAYWRRWFGGTPPEYYAFSVAGWEILSLNSEAAHGPGSPQLRWLEARLREPGTCRLAIIHRPRYSAGRHGDSEDVDPIWDALRGRATLVVSGNDHDMQRLHPIEGLTQFVSGAGGHSHYPVDDDDPRVAFADDEADGALRIVLRPGAADTEFVATDGRVLDSEALHCTEPDPGA